MAVFRRRLIIWLLKAYIKKWGKTIIFFFIIGLITFALLLTLAKYLSPHLALEKKETIGISGEYSLDSLPQIISSRISQGLTTVDKNGKIKPGIASSWEIKDNGKKYIFHLRKNLTFSDNTPVTSATIQYNFSDVTVQRPNKYTISYTLKDQYAPFLVTVSRPIFSNEYNGTGDYKIKQVDINGTFLKNVKIVPARGLGVTTEYKFYPTSEALKIAFLLGEVRKIIDVPNSTFHNQSMATYKNINVANDVSDTVLVTLFYNTRDSVLSDKKLRDGLSYALPNTFKEGERNHLPYPPSSFYFNTELAPRTEDLSHAKILIEGSLNSASASAIPSLTVKTLDKYQNVAKEIAKAWKRVGVTLRIETVAGIPNEFQMYLGDFNVPKDPDQYTLWHSDQVNNITKFKNLRIDKLLEDGRKSINVDERKRIYDDFQKYLSDEQPASFLYFPYSYTIFRE